jgi:hypothetical protein
MIGGIRSSLIQTAWIVNRGKIGVFWWPGDSVAVIPPDFPVDPCYKDMDQGERAFQELKRLTKINCWHRAEYESAAMWRLYADESKGIAICSTADRIRAADRPFRLDPSYGIEDLWLGEVRYADLLMVRLNLGMEERFFCQHRAFSSEGEFRAALSVRSQRNSL